MTYTHHSGLSPEFLVDVFEANIDTLSVDCVLKRWMNRVRCDKVVALNGPRVSVLETLNNVGARVRNGDLVSA